jgi:hypothetical protein
MLCAAHRVLGTTSFVLGAVATAHIHFRQGIQLYDSQQHRASAFLYGDDAGVVCHNFAALTLWILGYPDPGLARSQEAVTLARQIAHPYSLAFALSFAARKPVFTKPLRLPEPNKPNPSSYERLPAWLVYGSNKANARKLMTCSCQSTAGSPRALTQQTCKMPKPCSMS